MYGKSRGFAIVKFANEGDAARAIAGLNGLEVQGRNIEVRTNMIFTVIHFVGGRCESTSPVHILLRVLFSAVWTAARAKARR